MNAQAILVSTPAAALEAADPTTTALLTIDLDALKANYRTVSELASSAECAAVIKANAYGTGSTHAARALAQEGCKTFFVATFGEARRVRDTLPEATIYVLDGYFAQCGEAYVRENIRPVLSSIEEVSDWIAFLKAARNAHPAALHVDTGINRLGLRPDEARSIFGPSGIAANFTPALLVSHLACADQPDHSKNAQQLATFETLRKDLPDCPASLANSGGIHLGSAYHFDLVRAGFSLYGGQAVDDRPPLAPVVQLQARIAQVHKADAGESVGYGAPRKLDRPTRIATVTLGYADGIFRNLGARDNQPGMTGYIAGHPAPVLGRISMDLITLDVTDLPEGAARRGGWVEIIGTHVSINALAEQAGTIGYEILTSLGTRAQRIYIDAEGTIS